MTQVKVVYSVQQGGKTYPWHVLERIRFFKWASRGMYQSKEDAVAEAKRIETMPKEGEIVYETISGYGD